MIPPKIEVQKDRFLLSFEHIHTWVGCQESLQHLGGRGRGCREGGGKLRHRGGTIKSILETWRRRPEEPS